MITLALPNYASNIAWLAMESLCRQLTPTDWELIVFEDSDKPLGKEFYTQYSDRLAAAGCKEIKYIYSEERYPLNLKWVQMAKLAHSDSLGIILQASDDYSEPFRIETAEREFLRGTDWLHSNLANFYNVKTNKMMLFRQEGKTGVNIAISLRAILQMPTDFDRWEGVDSWLWDNMPPNASVMTDDSVNWVAGVFTDGFNRISKARRNYYRNPKPPFHKTQTRIEMLIPKEIIERLKKHKQL